MGAAPDDVTRDNAFWKFSLVLYGGPGVAGECLEAQDSLGVDVNVLLFCAWLAVTRGVTLTVDDLRDIDETVQAWHDNAVKPLRAARQFLKMQAGSDAAALRTRVKGIELEAEQIEQAMLFAYAQNRWLHTGTGDVAPALRANVALLLKSRGWRERQGCSAPLPQLIAAALAVTAD